MEAKEIRLTYQSMPLEQTKYPPHTFLSHYPLICVVYLFRAAYFDKSILLLLVAQKGVKPMSPMYQIGILSLNYCAMSILLTANFLAPTNLHNT